MDTRKQTIGGSLVILVLAIVVGVAVWARRDRGTDTSSQAETGADVEHGRGRPGASTPRVDIERADKATVSGRVINPDGQAIAGARVCAFAAIEQLDGAGEGAPRCVSSERDGQFRIEGLWPVATTIGASARGFTPSRWRAADPHGELLLTPGEVRESIEIQLAPDGVVLRGVVRDIAGGEIEGARVWTGWSVAHSDAAGAFELWVARGTLDVHASLDGYADGGVPAVAPGELVELFLTPASVLAGRVVRVGTDAPVAGIEVRLPDAPKVHPTRTDPDGRFRFDALEPGSYKPEAIADQLYGAAPEQVHLGFGETSEEVVITVHELAAVSGTILVAGPEPQPCAHGSITIEHADEGWARSAAVERRDGRVEIPALIPGTYRVQVACEGYVAREDYPDVVVEATERLELEWEVDAGLAIRGEVVDDAGQPVAGMRIHAQPIAEGEGARARQTDASGSSLDDGSFVIAGLLPGAYELEASGTGRSVWRPSSTEPVRVELAAADVEGVRITMPATGAVSGRVVDARGQPVPGVTVIARSLAANQARSSRTNDAGEFVLDALLPGATRLTPKDGNNGWDGAVLRKPGTTDDDEQGEVVEVTVGDTVEAELVVESRGGVIRGRVVDADGGPVPDAFVDALRMNEQTGANVARDRRKAHSWSWGEQPVLTDADGRFELDGLAASGKFLIAAHRKGGGEGTAEGVEVGAEVEVVIARTGVLGGTVLLADGGAPDQVTLDVYDRTSGFSRRETLFRTGGRWRMTEIPAGHFDIRATGGGGMVEGEADLAEGQIRDDVELRLEPLLTVKGKIVDIDTREPIAGLKVFGRNSAMHDEQSVTGADGRFTVDKLPHGAVRLMIDPRSAGRDSKYSPIWHIAILEPQPLVQDIGEVGLVARRIEPGEEPGDLGFTLQDAKTGAELEDYRIRVAAVHPRGPAETAGLVSGDEIVTVDGHDVRGALAPRWILLTRAPAGRNLQLGLADGRELSLVVGPAR